MEDSRLWSNFVLPKEAGRDLARIRGQASFVVGWVLVRLSVY